MTTKTGTVEHARKSWRTWIEPWYFVYAILGAIIAGLIPVLLPLRVGQAGSPAQVGWVMAAVSLGGLSAPLWGVLTDRYRLHRWVLIIGLFLTAFGLTAFAFSGQPVIWFVMALVLSVGAAGASTVANLFVVEMHPKPEWDERIGWLQTFYGLGQVVGLLLAGFLSNVDLNIGLLTSCRIERCCGSIRLADHQNAAETFRRKACFAAYCPPCRMDDPFPAAFLPSFELERHQTTWRGTAFPLWVVPGRLVVDLCRVGCRFLTISLIDAEGVRYHAGYFVCRFWRHGWSGPDALHARRKLVRAFRVSTYPARFAGDTAGGFCWFVGAGIYTFWLSGLAGTGGLCLCSFRLVSDERERNRPGS